MRLVTSVCVHTCLIVFFFFLFKGAHKLQIRVHTRIQCGVIYAIGLHTLAVWIATFLATHPNGVEVQVIVPVLPKSQPKDCDKKQSIDFRLNTYKHMAGVFVSVKNKYNKNIKMAKKKTSYIALIVGTIHTSPKNRLH